jgi:hypothetical protein
VVGIGIHRLDRQSVEQVERLGISHVRYTLYWSLWHDENYRREWKQGISRAVQAGLDPLVVVHQSPFEGLQNRTQVYRLFAQFMHARAAEFPQVHTWQLWNEMDIAFTEVFGAGHPEISLRQRGLWYAEMLKLAYPAIKRGNPDALVVTGGIASPIAAGFLDGLYDAGASYDVLAIHTYGFPLATTFEARGAEARRIMRSHDDNRPLWNTEFGLEIGAIPNAAGLSRSQVDSIQLDAWRTSVAGNAHEHIFERIYGYVLSEGHDDGYDLVRMDGSERPAYTWLRSWTHSHHLD